MANWTGGRLTKAGNDLQIKVEAGLCKLELTKIKLGDGTEDIGAVDTLTDLVGPKAVLSSVMMRGIYIRCMDEESDLSFSRYLKPGLFRLKAP